MRKPLNFGMQVIFHFNKCWYLLPLNAGARYKKVPQPNQMKDLKHVDGWLRDVRIHFTLFLVKNQNISSKK